MNVFFGVSLSMPYFISITFATLRCRCIVGTENIFYIFYMQKVIQLIEVQS
ncbi:hypothetical protein CHISP_1036 [Chitinispirillum alkaliphilum]|nr:hypothetical protein CHISP_1036 [Chitinispirillum alkaliphilum]